MEFFWYLYINKYTMGKFIITEEEKKRIRGLYEQETTSGTSQQSNVEKVDFADCTTIYNYGFNVVGQKYPATLDQKTLTIKTPNGKTIQSELSIASYPRSEVQMYLTLIPREWLGNQFFEPGFPTDSLSKNMKKLKDPSLRQKFNSLQFTLNYNDGKVFAILDVCSEKWYKFTYNNQTKKMEPEQTFR